MCGKKRGRKAYDDRLFKNYIKRTFTSLRDVAMKTT